MNSYADAYLSTKLEDNVSIIILNTPGLFEPPVRSSRATLPFRTEPSFR